MQPRKGPIHMPDLNASRSLNDLPEAAFLRQPQVLALVPISDATLWRWVKAKKFPAPVKLGPGTTAWRAEDVRAWCERIQPVSN